MTKEQKPLTPVDHAHCQADIKDAYNPMQIGALPSRWRKCGKKPTWYARETVAGEDGRKGAMSLCDECKAICAAKMGDSIAIEPLVGWNEKFHQLYENPRCVPDQDIARVLRDAGADDATANAFEQLIIAQWHRKT